MRLSVIELEKIILKELGFELYRILDHPHKLMHHFLKLLKASNEVARKAWNYLNDSYRTALCVHYPASTIAASCIYLSLRTLSVPMPTKPWWILMETSIDQIHDISAEVLNLYSQPKICLNDIKDCIQNSCKLLNIQVNYSFSFDEFFEECQPSIDPISYKNTSLIPSKNSTIFGKNIFNKDVNSSSSTVKELNNNDKHYKNRPSKTKSKSPNPGHSKTRRDDKKHHKKTQKRRNRSRSRSRSETSSSSESNSSNSHSVNRRHRHNKENRSRRRKHRESLEKKKRKRSYSNENSK